jgi:hypothetical protein
MAPAHIVLLLGEEAIGLGLFTLAALAVIRWGSALGPEG